MDKIASLRKQLHTIPEPSMKEYKTKELLIDFISKETSLEIMDYGNWFYTYKKGASSDATIAFRADIDAVLCPDGCARHLCGHDGHSAILAGLAVRLDCMEIRKDVYLIFQPAEEIGKGAAICSKLIEEKNISEIYGLHNIPGYKENQILLLEDTFACASTGMEIKLIGKESHAAYPNQGNNPALAFANIINYMNQVINEEHRGVLLGTVIGMELGSKSYGVSAGEGILRLTLRAQYQSEYDKLVNNIKAYANSQADENDLQCEITLIEEFPATENHKENVAKIRKTATEMYLEVVNPNEPFRWSEDFGYYLQKTKGAFFGVGVGENWPGLHTKDYEFNDNIIDVCIDLFEKMVL